jgi:hypothetical protein
MWSSFFDRLLPIIINAPFNFFNFSNPFLKYWFSSICFFLLSFVKIRDAQQKEGP